MLNSQPFKLSLTTCDIPETIFSHTIQEKYIEVFLIDEEWSIISISVMLNEFTEWIPADKVNGERHLIFHFCRDSDELIINVNSDGMIKVKLTVNTVINKWTKNTKNIFSDIGSLGRKLKNKGKGKVLTIHSFWK